MKTMLISGLAVCSSVVATWVMAQSSGIPREFPPESYTANQYVDSEGCAFIRAGISGNTNWVPRVDRSRAQLCNFEPTFAPAAPSVTPAAVEPVDEPQVDTPTVLTVTTGGANGLNGPVAIEIPQRRIPQAEPPATIAVPASERRALPAVIDAPVPVVETPVVEPAAVPTTDLDAPPRMTRAAVCAEAARTGKRFIDAATGSPVSCAPERVPIVVFNAGQTIPRPSQPAGPTAPAVVGQSGAVTVMPRQTVVTTATPVRARPAPAEPLSTARAVPASNPPARVGEVIRPPAGYVRVWDDGRLNPWRGLPNN